MKVDARLYSGRESFACELSCIEGKDGNHKERSVYARLLGGRARVTFSSFGVLYGQRTFFTDVVNGKWCRGGGVNHRIDCYIVCAFFEACGALGILRAQ